MDRAEASHELDSAVAAILDRLGPWLDSRVQTSEWRLPGSLDTSEQGQKVRVVISFLLRAYHELHAVKHLASSGMAVQALVVVRSLVEMAIDLRYIATNPLQLSSLYLEHESISLLRDGVELRDQGVTLPQQVLDKLDGLHEGSIRFYDLLSHIKGKEIRKVPSGSWTIEDRKGREQIGRSKTEDGINLYSLYKSLCVFAHGEARMVKNYLGMRNGSISLRLGPSWHKQPYVLYLSILAIRTILIAAMRIGAPIQKELFDIELQLDQERIDEILASGGALEQLSD